ncbi:MAG: CPBP family intramembrane metalloprotease [Crocinitomicaceae bacterium]|nr:CPBP family intramembrane metalloprotease [Crocinitomicaceae bacterium]
MEFIKQGSTERDKVGMYFTTIGIAFLSLVVGQLFTEALAVSFLGYSLMNVPEGADLNLTLSLLLIPFGFVLMGVVLSIKYLHKRPVISVFTSRESFDWKRFFTAFFSWGGIMSLFLIISIISGSPIEWNLDWSTFIPLILISLFLIPIQTTAEEVLFRGYLFQGFGFVFKKGWVSILLTGILFGLLHGANPEVAKLGNLLLLFYIGTGVFMALISHMDDGIELSMGYHAVNNIFASLIVTNDWQAFHTNAMFIDHSEPVFGLESFLTVLVLQPLLILFFSKVYRWHNWKDKILK